MLRGGVQKVTWRCVLFLKADSRVKTNGFFLEGLVLICPYFRHGKVLMCAPCSHFPPFLPIPSQMPDGSLVNPAPEPGLENLQSAGDLPFWP